MRFALFLLTIALTSSAWSQQRKSIQAEHNQCVQDGFYAEVTGVKSCEFSNLRASMPNILRTCNVKLMKNFDPATIDLPTLTKAIGDMSNRALASLTGDLHKRLYACGFMGEIQIGENGGSSKIVPFAANDESCGIINSLLQLNNLKSSISSDQSTKDQLRDQNRDLIRVYQRSGCGSRNQQSNPSGAPGTAKPVTTI